MNIENAVIEIPRYEARRSFVAYRTAIKENRATRDDVVLYRGLRAVLRGQKVIDINLAIGAAGVDARGFPRLVVGRADKPIAFMWGTGDGFTFSSRSALWGRKPKGETTIPLSSFSQLRAGAAAGLRGRTQTPLIPPQFRPTGDLADYLILWEAVWQPQPTRDPFLLKHIDGPFYVVLAAWDLTPLEQGVLRAKL